MGAISRDTFLVNQGIPIQGTMEAVFRGRESNPLVWGINMYIYTYWMVSRGWTRGRARHFSTSVLCACTLFCCYNGIAQRWGTSTCCSEIAVIPGCFLHSSISWVFPLRYSIFSFILKPLVLVGLRQREGENMSSEMANLRMFLVANVLRSGGQSRSEVRIRSWKGGRLFWEKKERWSHSTYILFS